MRLCRPSPTITAKEPLCQIILNGPGSSPLLSLIAVVPHWAALAPSPSQDDGPTPPPAATSSTGVPRWRTLHLHRGNVDDGGAPAAPRPMLSSVAFIVAVQTTVPPPPSFSSPSTPLPLLSRWQMPCPPQRSSKLAPPAAHRWRPRPSSVVIATHPRHPHTALHRRLQPLLIVECFWCQLFNLILACTPPISINIPPKCLLLRIPNR